MIRKKILPIVIFMILLFGMDYFSYMIINIFNITSINNKVLFNFICDVIYMIILFIIYHKKIIEDVKNYFKNYKAYINISIEYYFIGYLIMVVSNYLINIFFSNANPNNEEMVRTLIGQYPLYMFFSVAIYAPFVEELIFRKSIRDIFQEYSNSKINKYLYILVSGIIFAYLHVAISSNIIDYLYIIPYLGLGMALATLYWDTDNVMTNMSIHALHNSLAIIVYLIGSVML